MKANLFVLESLFDEDKILEWLTSNRYKQLELGVFMYAIVSLGVTFICYTGLKNNFLKLNLSKYIFSIFDLWTKA